MEIKSFRDLQVWQKAMVLVSRVYTLTERFPRSELFGLSIQLKRAAVSIPSNIAEGHARKTGHYLNHLNIALGSAAELQTQLELSYRLNFVDQKDVNSIIENAAEVMKMLRGLSASLEQRGDD